MKKKNTLTSEQERLLELLPSGHEDAIHLKELMAYTGYNSMDIKNVVQQLRIVGYPICSGPDGYWLTNDKTELKQTINLLTAHKETMDKTVEALGKTLRGLR